QHPRPLGIKHFPRDDTLTSAVGPPVIRGFRSTPKPTRRRPFASRIRRARLASIAHH
ncbi:unnamed protein product, partial [Hapterophycus canaliculatus]